MELICIVPGSGLKEGQIYNLEELGSHFVSVRERPGSKWFKWRFVINPPPNSSEEDIKNLEVLFNKLCLMNNRG